MPLSFTLAFLSESGGLDDAECTELADLVGREALLRRLDADDEDASWVAASD